MTPALALVFWVVGGLLVGLSVLVLLGASRYRALCHRIGAFTCDYRKGRRNGGEPRRFEPGVAVYSSSALLWFSAWSLRPRFSFQWPRSELVVISREPASGRNGEYLVRCQCNGKAFDLLMSDSAYVGLNSWLEANPSITLVE